MVSSVEASATGTVKSVPMEARTTLGSVAD
jgi:hypothetical protein